jgi:hydroxyacylglutathione hydrolase
MEVKVLTVGMFQSNCCIPYCAETREAVVIDAGDEGERILSFIGDNRLDVKYIINTHAHIDHVSALTDVAGALRVPVLMHKEDDFIFKNLAYQGSLFGLEAPKGITIDRFLKDGDEIAFGREKLKVLHVPGHSPGSIALLADAARPQIVFSGDTLFKGSIGRTDLFGGSYDQIMESLATVFLALPDDTIIYPGHGERSTIGAEKKYNPFLLQILS